MLAWGLLKHSIDGAELPIVFCDQLLPLTGVQGYRLHLHSFFCNNGPSPPDSLVGLLGGKNVVLPCRCFVNCFVAHRWEMEVPTWL